MSSGWCWFDTAQIVYLTGPHSQARDGRCLTQPVHRTAMSAHMCVTQSTPLVSSILFFQTRHSSSILSLLRYSIPPFINCSNSLSFLYSSTSVFVHSSILPLSILFHFFIPPLLYSSILPLLIFFQLSILPILYSHASLFTHSLIFHFSIFHFSILQFLLHLLNM